MSCPINDSVVKKFISLVSAIFLVFTPVGLVAAVETLDMSNVFSSPSPLVGLGMTQADLRKKMGRPLKKSPQEIDDENGYSYSIWTYKGFTVEVTTDAGDPNEDFVAALEITSQAFVTINGIRVGDRLSKVASLYRKEIDFYDGQPSVSVRNLYTGGVLTFTAKQDGQIRLISLRPRSALPEGYGIVPNIGHVIKK
jgi:hypothetical protein